MVQKKKKGGLMNDMTKMGKFSKLVLGIGILLTLYSCTIGTGAYISPQTHFDFPNSNVIPIGYARGEASATGFYPSIADANLKLDAIQNALKQKGGDLLIDATFYYDVKSMIILPLYITTLTVEGTACKMEIGKKELK